MCWGSLILAAVIESSWQLCDAGQAEALAGAGAVGALGCCPCHVSLPDLGATAVTNLLHREEI